MKQCYPKNSLFLAFFSLILYLPQTLQAQCTCADGTPPQTVIHNRVMTTSMENTVFTFPQFDPAVGILICTNVNAAITSVVRIRMENDEIYPASYHVNYRRTSTISGAGLSPTLVHNYSKNYGPYDLAETDEVYFSGPDYIITPRDTILKDKLLTKTVSDDITPFLGNGTVSYNYSLAGNSVISGGGNYLGGPLTTDRIDFTLTYSYCEATVLASGIQNFNVRNEQDRYANLTWAAVNEVKGNKYEIEFRKNNEPFRTIRTIAPRTSSGGAPTKYEYQYQFDKADAGQLYFRIRETDGEGKARYSTVKMIHRGVESGIRIVPNPVSHRFSMQFADVLNGKYTVQITNHAGMLVTSRELLIKQSNKIELDIQNPPTAGVYYIRAREVGGDKTYSGRIIFR